MRRDLPALFSWIIIFARRIKARVRLNRDCFRERVHEVGIRQLRNRRSCGFKGEKIIGAGIYGSLLGDISDSNHMMLLYVAQQTH